MFFFFFFKQKTAYEMRISDCSSDVCSSDLLDARDRVARRGADKSLLEIGVGDALGGADEAGTELDARRAHLQIARDRFAAADAAGDEDRQVLREFREDFLREHAGRDGADKAALLHPLAHQRIPARQPQAEPPRVRNAWDI